MEVLRWEAEGPPLVLIHGAGANAHVWTAPSRALAGFDVVAPSLPGRGGSEGPPLEGAESAAAWLDAVLEVLGGPPAIVLGHSYGGAVAMELALRSSRVDGLVLVSTGARLRVHPSVLSAAEMAVRTRAPMSAGFAFASSAPEGAADRYDAAARATPPEATLADWRACDAFDRLGRLDALRIPALVLGGVDDPLTPPKYHHYLAEHLPRAQLVLVEGAGHMLPWEKPKELARHVRAWSAGAP